MDCGLWSCFGVACLHYKSLLLVYRGVYYIGFAHEKLTVGCGLLHQVNLAYVQAAECVSEPVNREPPSREAQLLSLQNTAEFDILVIGGGATGCGCALDAVTRGESQRGWVYYR